MSKRHADLGLSDKIEWQKLDVRDMKDSIPDNSIDIAFDKGTLDAMIHGSPWSPPDDTIANTGNYLREISRVLKPTGLFLYVTYRQPHFIKPLLMCDGTNWDMQVEVLGASAGSFGYSGAFNNMDSSPEVLSFPMLKFIQSCESLSYHSQNPEGQARLRWRHVQYHV
ncbi:hypothetical protein Golomagni_07622 [Golovinomyces magnicellulatus]|nr:hypothetical protein Golomagni_07622 [Golovinomyces magnicellulatus]